MKSKRFLKGERVYVLGVSYGDVLKSWTTYGTTQRRYASVAEDQQIKSQFVVLENMAWLDWGVPKAAKRLVLQDYVYRDSPKQKAKEEEK